MMKGIMKGLLVLLGIIVLIVIAGALLFQPSPTVRFPTVSIVSPIDGERIPGDTVRVTVNSSNFNISTEGHYFVRMDSIERAGRGPTFVFENVTPGNRTIRAELRRLDNSSLFPPVVSRAATVAVLGTNVTNVTNATNVTDTMNETTNATNETEPNATLPNITGVVTNITETIANITDVENETAENETNATPDPATSDP